MTTKVIMPQMGESVTEGTITSWLKQAGEWVDKDESLLLISTDKIDVDVPSPASGYLQKVLFPEGETVEIDTVIAILGQEQSAAEESSESGASEKEIPSQPTVTQLASSPSKTSAGVEELRRTRSSPLVRKMAADHQIDLSTISGSGISGRVTKKDLEEYLADKPAAINRQPVASPAPARSLDHGKYSYRPSDTDRVEPFSPMRGQIADHMVISRETSVHVTTVFEVDMTRVAKLRAANKDQYAAKGVKLSFVPFILNAVNEGIARYPIMNSSVVDRSVAYKKEVNLGVAVAVDWGLLVPVIRNADEKSLLGLARSLNDLAERARERKLGPDELQGGTFTVTNPGVFGSLFGTPIINQPQVAILCVGTITKRAVVIEDDAIAVRHMMYLALSFDHRVIDGATADQFMKTVKDRLEHFPSDLV